MDGWCRNDFSHTIWCKAWEWIILKMWSITSPLVRWLRLISDGDFLFHVTCRALYTNSICHAFSWYTILSNCTSTCLYIINLWNAIPRCVSFWEFNSSEMKIFFFMQPLSRFDELPDDFDPSGKLPGSFDDGDPQTTNLYVGNLSPQVRLWSWIFFFFI